MRKLKPTAYFNDLRTRCEVRDWLRLYGYEIRGETVIDMLQFALVQAYQRGVQRANSLRKVHGIVQGDN
jgi:N-acetyl-anhydromuramyl-L-alanine amidase AmpD